MSFVNPRIIFLLKGELNELENMRNEIIIEAKKNNRDIKILSSFSHINDQIVRISKALKMLTNQYYR